MMKNINMIIERHAYWIGVPNASHRCEWGWNHRLSLTGSCGVDGFRDAPLLRNPNPTLLCLRPPPLLCLSPALLIFLRLHSSRDSRHALPSPCLQSNASLPSPPPRHLHWNPPLPSPSVSLPACLPPSQSWNRSPGCLSHSRSLVLCVVDVWHIRRLISARVTKEIPPPELSMRTVYRPLLFALVCTMSGCRHVYRTTW
ncbi:uncharacterized protein [Physcomitrium patens]|uniref:uncharacterized protein isoform X2 n=1 Tax=Physcomitrium patens TaxID=3218 RepID=UPI003CCDB77E